MTGTERPGSSADHRDASPPLGVVVRPLEPADLADTARLHIEHLGGGLFPRLGPSFVRRWHQTFVDTDLACGFVAVAKDSGVLAFALATTDQCGYVTKTLREQRLALAARGCAALLARPRLLATFVRTRSGAYVRRLRRPATSPTTDGHPAPPVAVVHAIVTTPAGRGRGLGRQLLTCVEARVATTQTRVIELVTDDGPDGAAGFYRALGWSQGESRTNKDGRTVATFTRWIPR